MARYPCSAGGHRYGGSQRSIYLSAFGEETVKVLARLCEPHYADAWAKIRAVTTDWETPVPDEPLMCPVCRLLDAPGYITATGFDGGEADKRAGCVCRTHAAELVAWLGWDAAWLEERP